jgi:transposase InsO family protein
MVEGMSNCSLDFDFCEHCVYGKKNRVRFPSGATRAEGILQLVHNDVFGPVSVPSLGKSVYYVSFIDDFSRNTWIYFLRKKSEVFDRFKEFKALVENQTEKIIKVLRTDNGREFCGNEFEEFCKKCGIERKKTTPYTPQQEWSCRKDEHDTDGKSKVHAQWCRVRERIMGRGSGYCMLPGQQITLINIG